MDITIAKHGTHAAACIMGNFTFPEYAKFQDVLDLTRDPGITSIIIDLSSVLYVDSAALGMFILLRGDAVKSHQNITIKGVKGQVETILRMANFDAAFTLVR